MKQKLSCIFILFLLFLTIVKPVFACSLILSKHFSIKNRDGSFCQVKLQYEDLVRTGDLNFYIQQNRDDYNKECNRLSLSPGDKESIKTLIIQYQPQDSSFESRVWLQDIILETQSDLEYASFLQKTSTINNDRCNCERLTDVKRHANWTSYETKNVCGIDPSCQRIPPEGCFQRVIYDVFWRSPLALVIGLLYLIVPLGALVALPFVIIILFRFVKRKIGGSVRL